jgi:hypothetical protein
VSIKPYLEDEQLKVDRYNAAADEINSIEKGKGRTGNILKQRKNPYLS